MKSVPNHIVTCNILLSKYIALIIASIFSFGAANASIIKDIAEYGEGRIDITQSLDDKTVEYICNIPTSGNDRENSPLLDLSRLSRGKRKNFIHKIYDGLGSERYGDDIVEQFEESAEGKLLKGTYSRTHSISFKYGFLVGLQSRQTAYCHQYYDTITLKRNDGSNNAYPIISSCKAVMKGRLILSPGDTISNITALINEYKFIASTCDVPNYRSIRIVSPDYPFALFEWEKYYGWNDDRESATVIASSGGMMQKKRHETDTNICDDVQYVVISDLFGRVIMRCGADGIKNMQTSQLPSGWYIITEYYKDKTVSAKRYISSRLYNW